MNKRFKSVNLNVSVYNEMPVGWKVLYGAATAPKGYIWIYNGSSRFAETYKTALLREPKKIGE